MTEHPVHTDFADLFPRADMARWRALALAALKGAPFERLQSTSADGLAVQPLYAGLREDRPRQWRASSGAWCVNARVDHPDPHVANKLLLADLENGADAIHLIHASPNGFGLPATRQALAATLAGVKIEARVPIEVDGGAATLASAAMLAVFIEASHVDPASYPVSFGLDPLGRLARGGVAASNFDADSKALIDSVKTLTPRGWRGRFAVADGRIVEAAGGTPAQELAFAVSAALAYWRAFEAAGVDLDLARRMIGFRLAVDAGEFFAIAKLRALRRLWAGMEEASGLAPTAIHIHAETSWRMMTRRDPWVNILRATMACFSAGVGGADSVSLMPFTQALGLPDAFARRVARNTQLVLIEESNLARVVDPVAGSGALEALTDGLCEKAWAIVQETEAAGGLGAALMSGAFQARVRAARDKRNKDVARRATAIVGVSDFPLRDEAPVAVLAPMPAPAPPAADALAAGRDAEPFERLRDRADATKASRPGVFLALLGSPADYAARATFARGFFEAGGFAIIESDDLASFGASGAVAACLCSSDAIYAGGAGEAARALAAAGARRILLAGRPGDDEAALRAAAIGGFIHVGSDVVATLESLW